MRKLTIEKKKKLHRFYKQAIEALQDASYLMETVSYTTATQRKLDSAVGKVMNLQRQLDR